jgi:hypothetical protein
LRSNYLTAWIPSGQATWTEAFWAGVAALALPVVALDALVLGGLDPAWLALGFLLALFIPADDRPAAERARDDTDYSAGAAVAFAISCLALGVALTEAPVATVIDTVRATAPALADALANAPRIDLAALAVGGIYAYVAKTASRVATARNVHYAD